MIPTNLVFKATRGLALNDAEQGQLLSAMFRDLEERQQAHNGLQQAHNGLQQAHHELQQQVNRLERTINELSASRSRLDSTPQAVDSAEPVRPKSNK